MSANAPSTVAGTWRGSAGNPLRWEAFEAGGRLAAILMHGGGQTRHTWRRAARRLQQRGIACLTFDQRGHGDSDWIDDGDYGLESFLADATLVLEQWNRPSVLIGASLGGIVSLMLAGSGAPLVRGLAMVDTAPQLDPKEIDWLVDFLGGEAERGFESPAAAARHVRRYFPELAITDASIEKSLRRRDDGRWHRHWDVRVVTGERNSIALPHEQRLHDDAARVRVPFVLVRAGQSELVSDAAIARLRSFAPGVAVIEMPGLHHLFSGAESVQIIGALEDFLAEAERTA